MEDYKTLCMQDDTFESARQSFDTVLQRLLKNMSDSNSTEGTITLKIDVEMRVEQADSYNVGGEETQRQIRLPSFSHKVTSQMVVKNEMKGAVNPEMELVWDDDLKVYVLKYVSNTAQRSFYDDDLKEKFLGGEEVQEGSQEGGNGTVYNISDSEAWKRSALRMKFSPEKLKALTKRNLQKPAVSLGIDIGYLDTKEMLIDALCEITLDPDACERFGELVEMETKLKPDEGPDAGDGIQGRPLLPPPDDSGSDAGDDDEEDPDDYGYDEPEEE